MSVSTSSPLLQDVLRPHHINATDRLTARLAGSSLRDKESESTTPRSPPQGLQALDDSDDELVGVTSVPGTPARSRAPSRPSSRASSPTRSGASRRRVPGPLLLTITKGMNTDPLRAFPTEVGQRLFALLNISDLARCSRVCKKWEKSQTINYVWFQHYRKEYFHDEDLPTGKWTRRESKQNWRQSYMKDVAAKDREMSNTFYVAPSRTSRPNSPYGNGSGYGSGSGSGYATPREAREEAWKLEADEKARPGKVEMREMYKELNGRKARAKGKFGGSTAGLRDKGGWADGGDDGF